MKSASFSLYPDNFRVGNPETGQKRAWSPRSGLSARHVEVMLIDIFEEPATRASYRKEMKELLDSMVQKLPEQVRLLRYSELEDR